MLYPGDRTLSPVTAEIAARWNEILRSATGTSPREFSKVGDSNTVNTNYLSCFAGSNVDLAGRDALRPTIDHFRMGTAGGTTPFNRVSAAAVVGWSTRSAIAGSPSPVTTELNAIHPQSATVMFGTNDIQLNDIDRYAADMWTLTDALLARGVVPLITTIPPRADSATADAWVPRYNAVARALAQTHRVPLIDLNRELLRLPGRGMGPDGLHMNTYTQGGAARGCVFTPAGLMYGFNTRNLIVLQTLDRLLDATARSRPAPDPDAPRMSGTGSPGDPFVVGALPFVDGRNTATGGTRALARYTGCMSTADESGPEYYYRFTVTRRTHVRAMVFVRGTTDIDVHLLDHTGTAGGCLQRADRFIVADLDPGTYTFVLDTFVAGGVTRAGEYLFAVIAE